MGRVVEHRSQIVSLLYGPAGPVVREVTRVARLTQATAKSLAPVDRGVLRASITVKVTSLAAQHKVLARIGSKVPHAIWQERGTGIYGPQRRPITPKNGPFLVFTPRKGPYAGRTVFARQVRGVRPKHYLLRALQAASPWPVRRNN